jgi:hypothetical protein
MITTRAWGDGFWTLIVEDNGTKIETDYTTAIEQNDVADELISAAVDLATDSDAVVQILFKYLSDADITYLYQLYMDGGD